MEILSKSNTRFELSNEGWKRMNAGRAAYELIREAVANAFDQEDITRVEVKMTRQGSVAYVTITDNSPTGIKDPALVTTVFLTDKEESHTKRGRKGRGLKELLSAARNATVETVGHTIVFDEGRTVRTNTRTSGTTVRVEVDDWTQDDLDAAGDYLGRMIPPRNVALVVNGHSIVYRRTRTTFVAELRTQIIKDGVQRDARRDAEVRIVNLAKGETVGWLYEMGIPVQELKTKFHVDVQQRIPLNDNRNNVDGDWLTQLYAECLEHLMPSLSSGALKHDWVSECLSETPARIHKEYIRKMYGNKKKLAIKTSNKRANDVAQQHGVELIDTTGLSYSVSSVLRYTIDNSEEVARQIDDADKGREIPSWDVDSKARTATLVKYLADRILGHDVNVGFFNRETIFTGRQREADYDASSRTIRFNTSIGLDFNNPINPKMLALIAHEFAHARHREHDDHFREEVERISGLISYIMFTDHSVLKVVFPPNKKSVGTGRAN